MVIQHHEPDGHAKKFVSYLQGQGHRWCIILGQCHTRRLICNFQGCSHSEGSLTLSTELLIFLQPDLIGWAGMSCTNWIVVSKVKVTLMVQNFIKSLFFLYLLFHWFLGNQTRCADVLLLITKPNTTKWHIQTVTLWLKSITRHVGGGGGFCCTKQQTLFLSPWKIYDKIELHICCLVV